MYLAPQAAWHPQQGLGFRIYGLGSSTWRRRLLGMRSTPVAQAMFASPAPAFRV